MNVVVLLGAPGAGKGTQAPLLAERLGIPVVATGDLFRAAVRDGTPLGMEARRYMDAGQLVPDETVALDEALAGRGARVSAAVLVDVPAEELIRRMSGRWVCRGAGHPYHETSSPPRVAGVCDLDGSELYQRADDQPETIRARMAQQLGALGEVIEHYRAAGILSTVDGLQGIGEVASAIDTALAAVGVVPAAAPEQAAR